jgi:hypothetical protein
MSPVDRRSPVWDLRPDVKEKPTPAIPARRAAGLTEHLLRLQATAGAPTVARAKDAEEARIALYHTALRPGRTSAG